MPEIVKTCKQCGIKDIVPETKISDDELCDFCRKRNLPKDILLHQRKHLTQVMEKFFIKIKEQNKFNKSYDALLFLSGGKDSAYLLHLLKDKYQLRILVFTAIHPLQNQLAQNNVEQIAKIGKVDIIKFKIDEKIYKKFIKKGTPSMIEKNVHSNNGCTLCDHLRTRVAYKIASEKNIPLVISGVTSQQIPIPVLMTEESKQYYFDFFGYHKMNKIFNHIFKNKLNNTEYDFDPENISLEKIPSTIYPLTFLPYSPEKAREVAAKKFKIEEKNLGYTTNCDAHFFFSFFSYRHYGVSIVRQEILDKLTQDLMLSGANKGVFEEKLKKAIFFVAKNKTIKIGPDFIKKIFQSKIKYNKKNKDLIDFSIRELGRLHYYSKYFGIKLK